MPPGFPNKNQLINFVQKPNSRVNGYDTFGKAYSLWPLLPETKVYLISYPDYRFSLIKKYCSLAAILSYSVFTILHIGGNRTCFFKKMPIVISRKHQTTTFLKQKAKLNLYQRLYHKVFFVSRFMAAFFLRKFFQFKFRASQLF